MPRRLCDVFASRISPAPAFVPAKNPVVQLHEHGEPFIIFKKHKEIDFGDDRHGRALAGYLPIQVVHDELLVGGVEPEPRWQVELGLSISLPSHPRARVSLKLSASCRYLRPLVLVCVLWRCWWSRSFELPSCCIYRGLDGSQQPHVGSGKLRV
ncbi:hypothetical protein MUK42_37404 [Musa troglodytarum]|uniref:Uncharacterized protein n=1 Tax=Musa troglodytarum TaxID=320322 RepID=A0A9E7GU04_9LILI|nr:hypothetical protein MUK42_37404 [Musa troglodytarum]